jgi:hypothetical protein
MKRAGSQVGHGAVHIVYVFVARAIGGRIKVEFDRSSIRVLVIGG